VIALVNANRMRPLIAPLGLDYVATTARRAGLEVEVLDLALAADPAGALAEFFAARSPRLVGLTMRNVDDCFWPSAQSFVPEAAALVGALGGLTDAPVVVGGVGYSIFAEALAGALGAGLGVRGDGETAIIALAKELDGRRRLDRVPGLVWRDGDRLTSNPPAWPEDVRPATSRDSIDNAAYFRLGGQGAVETKRGCDRRCLYCADPLAKGPRVRRRSPADVADEFAALAAQGVDVLHLADAEFNVPGDHARAVCDELARRGMGDRVRWYAYLAVVPFDESLAAAMRRAGCVGINFTGDAASAAMLRAYRQPHTAQDLARAVRCCREAGIAVMVDLMLGGPGETPETLRETIAGLKAIGPDCVGAALGVRLYPGTGVTARLLEEGPLEGNPGLRRRYDGPADLVRPTFYIAPALGPNPAALVREMVAGDERFFEPAEEAHEALAREPGCGYNYNDNAPLERAIAAGARGAYWDILRRMRRRDD
jgi:radical SAM superfamily enzyme YgiQ (UPF0313 family)